jgi:Na+/H+ antiporter NhaB
MKCVRLIIQQRKRKWLVQFVPNTNNLRDNFQFYKDNGTLLSVSRGVFVAPCIQKL